MKILGALFLAKRKERKALTVLAPHSPRLTPNT